MLSYKPQLLLKEFHYPLHHRIFAVISHHHPHYHIHFNINHCLHPIDWGLTDHCCHQHINLNLTYQVHHLHLNSVAIKELLSLQV